VMAVVMVYTVPVMVITVAVMVITRAIVVVALILMALTDDVIVITVICDVPQVDIYKLVKD